jgi:hypothetical protein
MDNVANMSSVDEVSNPDGAIKPRRESASEPQRPQTPTVPETPKREYDAGATDGAAAHRDDGNPPTTPQRTVTRKPVNMTPRIKKKVPWKGKSIMVLLPRDDERGRPGNRPMPLDEAAVGGMMKSWEHLGYNTHGFDLDGHDGVSSSAPEHSQSKGAWPDFDDVVKERSERNYTVTLPDLNGKFILMVVGFAALTNLMRDSLEEEGRRTAGGET